MSDPAAHMWNALRLTRRCLLICTIGGAFMLGRATCMGEVVRAIVGTTVALTAAFALDRIATIGGFAGPLRQFLTAAPRVDEEG